MAFRREAIKLGDLKKNLADLMGLAPQGKIADAMEDGAWVIALQARDNALAQGLFKSGDLIDNIVPRKINQFRVDVEARMIYSAAHEFGVTVEITEKQRGFFWAMWAETKDDMWKALALSTTYTIPARPYLRPAIDERSLTAIRVAGKALGKKLEAMFPKFTGT